MERAILKNVAINFVGLVLPTFISLATIPTYIHLLGVERYGFVALIWTLIGYFGVLDFGMSIATENQISKACASGDTALRARLFWSAFWLNLVTGLCGSVVVLLSGWIYVRLGYATTPLQHEMIATVPWLALAVPISNVSWVFAGAINGAERFGVFNTNQTIGTFIFQLLPIGAAFVFGATLPVVIAAAIAARLIAGAMLGAAVLRILDVRRVLPPDRKLVRELFGYGGWVVLGNATSGFADTMDRTLIGFIMGARFVTYYAVPQNLVTKLQMLQMALHRTLFPRLSALEREGADRVARDGLSFMNAVLTPPCVVGIFALGPFLHLWVGHAVAVESLPVGRILIIAVWFFGQSALARILLQAQGHPIASTRVSLITLPAVAIALWIGIHAFGILGAAWVIVARAAIENIVLSWLARIRARQTVFEALAHLGLLVVSLALAGPLAKSFGIATSLGAGVVVLLCSATWSWMSSPGLRTLARMMLARIVPHAKAPETAK
ncbi:flippase [Pararobbsia silviterrae]|uniref:Flippase n=1 Tax=Pararobbsia silviterrae TaxID=1792498 RepID=A0A494XCM1_9BURK|nr:flippase [Pararobbsia silviterrae]RKP45313.1 flippase [Pararobbsia silviterrae]